MGWTYGKISGRTRGSFLVIPNLMWETALRLDSSTTCGVRIRHLKGILLNCTVLLA
jgi:hypothetical protein